MPTKRTFDMVIITVVLLTVTIKVAKAAAYRWHGSSTGFLGTLGKAVKA